MQHFPKLLLLFALLTVSTLVSAQTTPKLAAGIRFGYPLSLSVKYSPGDGDNAFEAFAGRRGFGSYSWTTVGGLYQVHQDLELGDIEGLQWYVGGGAAVLFWNFNNNGFSNRFSTTSIGILANAGLNYTFEDAPVNLSLDWMPQFLIGSTFTTGFVGSYGAISARYIISR